MSGFSLTAFLSFRSHEKLPEITPFSPGVTEILTGLSYFQVLVWDLDPTL